MIAWLLACSAPGCHRPFEDVPLAPIEPVAKMPPVEELVKRYNDNVALIRRLWARTHVKFRWHDDKNKPRLETGEGVLMYVRPHRIALTLGKLGETGMWAGCDEQRYWLFDLREKTAFVGRHENFGKPETQRIPLSVYPHEVPQLLGLVPMEAAELVGVRDGYALLRPRGTQLLIMLDPHTARPGRIDLLGSNDQPLLKCRLSNDMPVEIADLPPEEWPRVATLVECRVANRKAMMILKLTLMTDGVQRNKIKDRAFDFEVLKKKYKPDAVENLDD